MNKTFNQQINSSSTRHPESILGSYQCKEQTLCIHTPQMLKQVQHDKCLVNDDNLTINCNFFKAFTLAEVMIVLAVIGILVAILLPTAQNMTPNENILKFKKAHNTLHTAIRELVNSDEYYLNGDLGTKANGDLVDSDVYFCSTLAQIINAKTNNCTSMTTYTDSGAPQAVDTIDGLYDGVDFQCDYVEEKNQIQTYFIGQDGVYFIDNNGYYHFGKVDYKRMSIVDNFKQYDTYKTFCIDIDGFNRGEKPFGYGIRVDGKILNGTRANEWLEKSIHEK